MKLKLAVATLLTALLIVLPVEVTFSRYTWQYDPTNFPKMIVWAGCQADLYVSEDVSPTGSFYDSYGHRMFVGTHEDPDIPYYAGLMILMHETGHCLQDQAGLLANGLDPVKFELDADRWSADLMCGLGLDGRKLLRDTFQWAHDSFGYNGDENHGSLDERISQGDKATACDKRNES